MSTPVFDTRLLQPIWRCLLCAAVPLVILSAAQPVAAGILVSYSGNSTNDNLSGATATALFEFGFSDPLDDARRSISVTIKNTTEGPVTNAQLTGLAFDTPAGPPDIVFDSGTFTTTSKLGTVLTGDVTFNPFTAGSYPFFNIAFSDDKSLEGGNPNIDSLGIGDEVTLQIEFTFSPEYDPVTDTPSPSQIEADFLSGFIDGSLRTAVRFMAIEGGPESSDKILGTVVTPPSPKPPPGVVPEPASIAVFGFAAFGIVFGGIRGRKQAKRT